MTIDTPPPLVGATVIDAELYGRRGTILSARPDTLAVTVQWRSGQFTTLRPGDIARGRYKLIVGTT